VSLHRRLVQILALLVGVLLFGTAGYALIERWTLFDALYMTVITVASVGFGEVHPLSAAGRVFTIVLIVVGLGTAAYSFSTITAFIVEGDLGHLWEKRKMERRIAGLRDHVIVCGGGETGRHIARELLQTRTAFVCVERDPAQVETLLRVGEATLCIVGDATDQDVLTRARVTAARGLIACMAADKDNLFAVLTARELNPGLRIVSRVVADAAGPKLVRAGADAVVSVPTIGALRIASEMIRPHVVNVLDAMLRESSGVRVQEIAVGEATASRTLGSLRLRERAGITVFALRERQTLGYRFNPPPDWPLHAGDVLFACADPGQVAVAAKILTEG
jgi:voltage-gated potassium channel